MVGRSDGRAEHFHAACLVPALANATAAQRSQWEIASGGYGIHWPETDEDLSTDGLLRGARAPKGSEKWRRAT